MILSKLLKNVDADLRGVCANAEINTPVTDSRECTQGDLFICIEGTRFNGADFALEAVECGAAAVVCSEKSSVRKELSKLPLVIVENTRDAAAFIWYNYFGGIGNMRLFGITGTNGKTSTAAFLSSVLAANGGNVGVIGTLGCYAMGKLLNYRGSETIDIPASMTTPDPKYLYGALAHMRDMGVTDVVMEVSSHAIAQKKIAPLIFDYGIFTNLSPEHMDFHRNVEEYFAVKRRFVEKSKYSISNTDDLWGARIESQVQVSKNLCFDVKSDSNGVSYKLFYNGKEYSIATAVCGDFTVYNTMCAAVCAICSGCTAGAVEKGISETQSICGRMEKIANREEFGFDVIIDYAHTPGAMESVLSGLFGKGRNLVVVFGCGGDRDREKRSVMGSIACRYCSRVIVTTDNPRGEDRGAIINDIVGGLPNDSYTVIEDRKKAIEYAISTASKGDIILLLGKGHEEYETGPGGKTAFSEREICVNALRAKLTNN